MGEPSQSGGCGGVVLCAANVFDGIRRAVAERYEVVDLETASADSAIASLPSEQRTRAEVLVTRGSNTVTSRMMDALPALRLIACAGSGYEAIDVSAAAGRQVAVTNCPGANAVSVAELAMGLTVALLRRIPQLVAHTRMHGWPHDSKASTNRPRGVCGLRMGIFGLGSIGRLVAPLAEAFKMEVAYHGRRLHPEVSYPYVDSLANLAQWADVLLVAARSTPQNVGVVDVRVLQCLGERGYLVNVARAALVDENALLNALRSGNIAGAALDVVGNEQDLAWEYRHLDNVIVTPHIGADTEQGEAAMARTMLANLIAHFSGTTLPNPVAGSSLRT